MFSQSLSGSLGNLHARGSQIVRLALMDRRKDASDFARLAVQLRRKRFGDLSLDGGKHLADVTSASAYDKSNSLQNNAVGARGLRLNYFAATRLRNRPAE